MIYATFKKHILHFKKPSGTSRGILTHKETYIITLQDGNKKGLGECNLFKGLSIDDVPKYEEKLQWVCENINLGIDVLYEKLTHFPSIQFGIEQAFINLNLSNNIYFPSEFTKGKKGIPINGLIWMGIIDEMKIQFQEKIVAGYKSIKLKIGINWQKEYKLLKEIRKDFSAKELEIRVDANGAFTYNDVKIVLEELAELHIHSIEQPIKPKQIDKMTELCNNSPTPIALDEELIGIFNFNDKKKLLTQINPQYIILKPSLIGGFKGGLEWIEIADYLQIKWWVTSALESNIGLNALAQWTYTLQNSLPQGLGTGALFSNNFKSNLYIDNSMLYFKTSNND